PTEHRVDARWLLRKEGSDRTFGSLRIVSHPDLPPGFLRAHFTFVTSLKEKSDAEIMKTIEDYQMDVKDLEVYSVDEHVETENKTYEAPFKELEDLFGVKIFKND
ncbi:MAG: hypothetical protein R3182_11865, partial [Draconibacterium sp.]|nr:hypothetical protein [Draconibacterium sp.]